MEKIDFVIMWVDGEDPAWQKKKKKFLGQSYSSDEVRYRDYGTLKYLFRSIENNCTWVNKIHFVTDHQIPQWLNVNHPKLNIVDHQDYIPNEYLPTFNSNVIETNLFRLKSLSEKFVLFNDDTFLNDEVHPVDFFVDDNIKDYGVYNKIAPTEDFAHLLVNNLIVINKYFSKKESLKKHWKKQFRLRYGKHVLKNFFLLFWNDIPGYYNPHLPQPHFKSTFTKVYNLEKNNFDLMFSNKVRKENDMTHWLFRYWNLEEGNYVPQKNNFGKLLMLSESNEIEKQILQKKSKVICINDDNCDKNAFIEDTNDLINVLQKRYPNKSKFEK